MVDKITDSEKLMYDIMGAIADGNVIFCLFCHVY